MSDTSTTELTLLTDHAGDDSSPAWSPDGAQIAFVSGRDYFDADTLRLRRDLYIMEADGSNQRHLTETGSAATPVWHPNGRFIGFRANLPSYGLFRMDALSKEMCQIVEPLSSDLYFHPKAWSSDGRYLLVVGWTRDPSKRESSLQIIDLATGQAHRVFSRLAPNSNPAILGADWFTSSTN